MRDNNGCQTHSDLQSKWQTGIATHGLPRADIGELYDTQGVLRLYAIVLMFSTLQTPHMVDLTVWRGRKVSAVCVCVCVCVCVYCLHVCTM